MGKKKFKTLILWATIFVNLINTQAMEVLQDDFTETKKSFVNNEQSDAAFGQRETEKKYQNSVQLKNETKRLYNLCVPLTKKLCILEQLMLYSKNHIISYYPPTFTAEEKELLHYIIEINKKLYKEDSLELVRSLTDIMIDLEFSLFIKIIVPPLTTEKFVRLLRGDIL